MDRFDIDEKTYETLKSILERDGYEFREMDSKEEKGGFFYIDSNGNKTEIADSFEFIHPLFGNFYDNGNITNHSNNPSDSMNTVSIGNSKDDSPIFEDSDIYSDEEIEMAIVDDVITEIPEQPSEQQTLIDLNSQMMLSNNDYSISNSDQGDILAAA